MGEYVGEAIELIKESFEKIDAKVDILLSKWRKQKEVYQLNNSY